jgi:hypothetical protein
MATQHHTRARVSRVNAGFGSSVLDRRDGSTQGSLGPPQGLGRRVFHLDLTRGVTNLDIQILNGMKAKGCLKLSPVPAEKDSHLQLFRRLNGTCH